MVRQLYSLEGYIMTMKDISFAIKGCEAICDNCGRRQREIYENGFVWHAGWYHVDYDSENPKKKRLSESKDFCGLSCLLTHFNKEVAVID